MKTLKTYGIQFASALLAVHMAANPVYSQSSRPESALPRIVTPKSQHAVCRDLNDPIYTLAKERLVLLNEDMVKNSGALKRGDISLEQAMTNLRLLGRNLESLTDETRLLDKEMDDCMKYIQGQRKPQY